jgi:hypothetical protein
MLRLDSLAFDISRRKEATRRPLRAMLAKWLTPAASTGGRIDDRTAGLAAGPQSSFNVKGPGDNNDDVRVTLRKSLPRGHNLIYSFAEHGLHWYPTGSRP